jgi:hypothetical protein
MSPALPSKSTNDHNNSGHSDNTAREMINDAHGAYSLLPTSVPAGPSMTIMDHNQKAPCEKARDVRRPKTLADIMESVRKAPDLRERKRRHLLSALNTVARVLGKAPRDILAQPVSLRKELSQASYLIAGLTKRRWTDTRSLTLNALQIGGVQIAPGRRRRSVFSPAWIALRRQINGRFQMGLSRFMNFCSLAEIEPHAVDTAAFELFRVDLLEKSLIPQAENIYRETCRLWDRTGSDCDTWPAFRVGTLPPARRYSLGWSTYPPSFQINVEAFLTRSADDNIYAPGREYFRPLRKSTVEGHRRNIQVMATALIKSGIPPTEVTGLAVLVEPENARRILEFFYLRAGKFKTE